MSETIHIPDKVTIGEMYKPAMKITDSEEAKQYLEACILHTMIAGGHSRAKATEIEKSNLGYFAGYYDSETRERVERLFNCSHPIFGQISEGEPTAQEAFDAGKKLAESEVNNVHKR